MASDCIFSLAEAEYANENVSSCRDDFSRGTLLLSGPGGASRGARAVRPPADDVANFLAGVPLPDASPLSALQRSPAIPGTWRLSPAFRSATTGTIFQKCVPGVRRSSLPHPDAASGVLFFRGTRCGQPARAFSRCAGLYSRRIGIGGLYPAPNTLAPEDVAVGLENLRKSAEVILSLRAFHYQGHESRTGSHGFSRSAAVDLHVYCADWRRDCVSRYVGVVGDGTLQEYGKSYSGSSGMLPGVRIEFRARGRSERADHLLCSSERGR